MLSFLLGVNSGWLGTQAGRAMHSWPEVSRGDGETVTSTLNPQEQNLKLINAKKNFPNFKKVENFIKLFTNHI